MRAVDPYTMTSMARRAALVDSVRHIVREGIPGDIAECGVWRGGSMMLVAKVLLSLGEKSRLLYLYDTFDGMSKPTEIDRSLDGISAEAELAGYVKGTGAWCYASLEDVRKNIATTGYPADRIHLIKGRVEETIPGTMPNQLALLRLDTDWYESTRHELTHLYPRLVRRGILILDDYGHWQGARRAVDEFFEEHGCGEYLHRVDYTGRLMVKTS